MESPSFIQTLQNKNWRFENATTLDDVLCLATMIATEEEEIGAFSSVNDARMIWLEKYEGNCNNCPHAISGNCLAYYLDVGKVE